MRTNLLGIKEELNKTRVTILEEMRRIDSLESNIEDELNQLIKLIDDKV
jgi:hypothetical protein